MMRNKRKSISWSLSVEISQDKEKKQLPLKRAKVKKNLSTGAIEFAGELSAHLELSLFDLITYKLEYLKKQHQLFAFMQHIDYSLFNWALEHKNLHLITYLLENLSHKQCFIMLCYKDYQFLKDFITTILRNTAHDTPIDSKIIAILKAIAKIEPQWQIQEVIKNCIIDQNTLLNSAALNELQLLFNLNVQEKNDYSAQKAPAGNKNISYLSKTFISSENHKPAVAQQEHTTLESTCNLHK